MKSTADEFVVHRSLPRYGLAVLSVAIGLGVALLLDHFHFRAPAALLLLFAVAIASWYGGRGPGVMAAILSIAAYYWYFVEPVRTIYIYLSEIPHFVTFVAFAVLLSWFGAVRRRVESGLRERAALLDLTHDTVFVMDMDGMIKYWNRGAEERYGWTAEQAVGRFVHGLLKTVFPVPVEELKDEITHTSRWEGELRHTRKDGTEVVVASRWSLERNEHGAPVAIMETNNDVTERKRAEEALHRLNRELRAISNCNQTLLRATDEQSLLNEICRIVCEEAGYKMAWVGYAEYDEAKTVRPVAWTGAEEGYLATAGITWAETERACGPTGAAIRSGKTCCTQDFATDPRLAPWREDLLQRGFCSGIAVPLKDEEGRAFGSLTINSGQPNAFTPEEIRLLEELAGDMAFGIVNMRSQAARKRAEQEVTLLSFALDRVSNAAILTDDGGRIHYVNEEACRGLGYTRAQLLGMGVEDIDPDFPGERWADHWRDLREHRSLSFESRHRARDGHIFPVEVSANYFEYGGRAYNLGLARDITDRKQAEEALETERKRMEVILSALDTGLSLINPDMTIAWVNQKTREMFPAGEPVGQVCHAFYESRDTICEGCGTLQAFISGKVVESEQLVPRAGRWYSIISQPIMDASGRVVNVLEGITDITERKRAEEKIRRHEAELRQVLDFMPDLVAEFDADRKRLYANRPTLDYFGVTPEEWWNTSDPYRFYHPDDRQRIESIYAQPESPFPREYEVRLRRADGEYRWFFVQENPLRDEAGRITRWYVSGTDIEDRKQAEQALRQSEERLRLTLESTQIGIFDWDVAHDMWYASPVYYTALGYEPREGPADRAEWVERLHPEDRERVTRILQDILTGKIDRYEYEARLRHADGSYRWVQVRALGIQHDSDGKVTRELGVRIDITERKQAEEALRRSEAYLADAQRLTHTGVWAGDRNSKPLYWSEEVYRIFGFDPQQGLPTGEQALERIHPEDFEKFQRATINEKGYLESEYRLVLPDGTVKYVFGSAHPVFDRNGEIVEVVGVIVDITERKRAEEALRRAEGYLVEAQRLTHTGAWATDAVPEPLYWSEELFRLYGLDPQQGFPTHDQAMQRVHPEDRDRYVQAFHRVIYQKVDSDVEFRTVLPDGTIRYLYGLGHPILNTNGDVVEVVGTTVDITERKRAEEERVRLRQLEADLAHINRVSIMGELAASISHELNQPIAVSILNASLVLKWLERDPPDPTQVRQWTTQIIDMGTLASEIIDRLRSLYKKEPPKRESVSINEVIGEMVVMLRGEATRHAVSVRADLADSLPVVLGDRVQIQQVLMNLMLNGIEAMSGTGGVLTIKSQLKEGGQIEISVNDTGPGLPPGKADRIFDAFFTTKPHGSGMGLAISKSIVESHGGRIWANGNGGRGATFHFTVPATPSEASLPAHVV
jgi:PAS domain S-box-containing protein